MLMALILLCVYTIVDIRKQPKSGRIVSKFNPEKQKNCNGWDLYICSFFPWGQPQISTRQGTVSLTWGVNGQSSGRGNPDRQEAVEGFN